MDAQQLQPSPSDSSQLRGTLTNLCNAAVGSGFGTGAQDDSFSARPDSEYSAVHLHAGSGTLTIP